MKNISIILFGFITLNACSSLFWRAGGLSPEKVVSNDSILEYTVIYLERDSWNLMNGTTVKKSYQTELVLYPDGKYSEPKKLANLNSWTLPGLVAYNAKADRLVWVQGMNDEYGTYLRKLGYANSISSQGLQNAVFFEPNQQLWNLALSDNAETIAFVISKYGEDLTVQKPQLAVWNISNPQPTLYDLPSWQDSPDHKIQWIANGKLSIQMDSKKMIWTSAGLK